MICVRNLRHDDEISARTQNANTAEITEFHRRASLAARLICQSISDDDTIVWPPQFYAANARFTFAMPPLNAHFSARRVYPLIMSPMLDGMTSVRRYRGVRRREVPSIRHRHTL